MFTQKLIDYLNALAVEPHKTRGAICFRVRGFCKQNFTTTWPIKFYVEWYIDHLMTQWPGYSGSPSFPVPHPTLDPAEAWIDTNIDRWDPTTEYGKARRDLCKYLAARLQSELEQ